MSGAALLCLNLSESRRRSIRIWQGIPLALSDWRPDPNAMSCFEMVRHVLEADYLYGQILRERRSYSGVVLSLIVSLQTWNPHLHSRVPIVNHSWKPSCSCRTKI